VTFKQCIFSGIKNIDSSIGVYAGSAHSYECFNKLFDPIINEYHGFSKEKEHISDMKSELKDAKFTEE
jgi:arginine kinase